MYIGAPIVASNVCGNPELVADGVNGLTVPFNDAPALAAAITKILERPELAAAFVARSEGADPRFRSRRAFQGEGSALPRSHGRREAQLTDRPGDRRGYR